MFDFLMRNACREKLIPILAVLVLGSAILFTCWGIASGYRLLIHHMASAGTSLPPARVYWAVFAFQYPATVVPNLLSIGVFILLLQKNTFPFGGMIGVSCIALNFAAFVWAGFATYMAPMTEILSL